MSEFYRDRLSAPIDTSGYAPVAIRPSEGGAEHLPLATAVAGEAVAGRWLSPQNNSRLNASLPDCEWTVRWQGRLGIGVKPSCIQHTAARVLVQCATRWMLFDRSGALVGHGSMGSSDLLLDPELSVFFSQTLDEGQFKAFSLETGDEEFATSFGFANEFHRDYMTRLSGNRLVVAGFHRENNPHKKPPELSGMEVWSLGDPLDVDGVKLLRSETRNGVLNHKSLTFLVTRTLGGFAIAIENGVYLVDESLDLNSGMVGSFTPKLLSSDEAGRLYLVVDSHDGHELWVLAPNGERLITHTHPANEGAIVAPPLVGFDHSIYLLTASRAYALDPSGALRWECALDGPLGGAVVTADNRLVVSAGNSVSTFELVTDDDGEESIRRRSLLTIEGQRFGSAPILTPDGLLLVASDEALFCLEPKPPADPS